MLLYYFNGWYFDFIFFYEEDEVYNFCLIIKF